MTEGEWPTCTDPYDMWRLLDPDNTRLWKTGMPDPTPSPRKARLLACATARLLDRNMDPRLVEVVEACEQIADGEKSQWGNGDEGLRGARASIDAVWGWVWCCTAENIYYGIRESFIQERGNAGRFYRHEEVADLIREIVGNPFRKMPDLRAAYTKVPMILSMAEAAYADRTARGALYADRLAVLADAMEDAGCDDEEMLRHLRSEERLEMKDGDVIKGVASIPLRGPHVRGCWVLDRILGKS